MEINLLPWRDEIVAYNKKFFKQLIMLVIVIAAVFLFGVSRLFFSEEAYEKSYIQILEEAKSKIVNSISGYMNDKKMQDELATRLTTLRQLQIDRFTTVRLLNGLTKITPRGVYFTSLSRDGAVVSLSGNANSNLLIAQFMKSVDESPEIDVLSLQKVEKTEGANTIVTKFDLKVKLTMGSHLDPMVNPAGDKKSEIHNPIQTLKNRRDEKDAKIENISKTGTTDAEKAKSP